MARLPIRKLAAALLLAAPVLTLAANYKLSPDGNAVVRLDSITALGSGSFNTAVLQASYPGWTVNLAGPAAGGSLTQTQYDAGWRSGDLGGGDIKVSYSQSNAVAVGHQLHHVQFINTNLPLGGATSPYIDPQPNDDTLPFYWTSAEVATRSTDKTLQFSDFSTRRKSSLASTDPITWSADLYAVEWDGATTIDVRQGLRWGWTMKPATVGNSAAVFTNPDPTCPPATCSGIGTSRVQWGIGQPGSLSFAGTAYSPFVGDTFKLGTLSFTNGATQVGSALDGVTLDISMAFANVPEENFRYQPRIRIVNTLNNDDPYASADWIYFAVAGFNYSFRVFEGRSATVDVMAKLTPTLRIPTGDAANTAGWADKGLEPPDAFEPVGYQLELVAFANASGGGFIAVVPEPGSAGLIAVGLAGLAWRVRRKHAG